MPDEPKPSKRDQLIEGAQEVAEEAAKKIPGWAWAAALLMVVVIGGFYTTADKLIAYQESTSKNSLTLQRLTAESEHFKAAHDHCMEELGEIKKRIASLEAAKVATQ